MLGKLIYNIVTGHVLLNYVLKLALIISAKALQKTRHKSDFEEMDIILCRT